MLICQLQRINNTKNFGGIPPGASRVINDGANDLFGVNEEDGADG